MSFSENLDFEMSLLQKHPTKINFRPIGLNFLAKIAGTSK